MYTGALVYNTNCASKKCNDASRFFYKFVNIPLRIFHTPHFPHSSFSTLLIFHTPHFPHSSFSTLRIFHTPHFPHSALRIIHRTYFFPRKLNPCFWRGKHDLIYYRKGIPVNTILLSPSAHSMADARHNG